MTVGRREFIAALGGAAARRRGARAAAIDSGGRFSPHHDRITIRRPSLVVP
jgi:hypothetical protein